jgi:hypothetical protein
MFMRPLSRTTRPVRPVPPQRQSPATRVAVLWSAAGQAREKGEHGRAEALYGEVRQRAVNSKDLASEMFATYQLGSAAEHRGDYGTAQECYDRVQDIARRLRSATIEAQALQGLERLARLADNALLARAYAEQARRAVADRHTQGYPKHAAEPDGEPVLRPWTR